MHLEFIQSEWKKILSEFLRKVAKLNSSGMNVPLLSEDTESIIINCHKGFVVDAKPTLRFT